MAESVLKALVVGSGWGRNHAAAYHNHPDVELVGICARSVRDRSLQLAERYGVSLYTDLDKALEDTAPDVVSIATKEPEHEAATVAALQAGAHVCCEKMLASSIPAAERMVAAAESTGRQLMTSYNYRWSPSALQLRAWLDAGRLGQVACATALAFGYCLHHTLDLVCSLLGEVEAVFCAFDDGADFPTRLPLEGYDGFLYSAGRVRSMQLRMADGAIAHLMGSDAWQKGHPAVRLDVLGSEARCTMSDIVGTLTLYGEDRQAEQWAPSLLMDRFDLPSTTEAAVTAFVNAIANGDAVPVSGEVGLNRLRIEAAALVSAREGRWVEP